jgi:hypothetical protein
MTDQKQIPSNDSREVKRARKEFIITFYAQWIASNPTKQIFNEALHDYIKVRFLSIQETAGHASHTYRSTVAVTYLTEILENARPVKCVQPKSENKNQRRFSEMIVMEYLKESFGTIKLTVGILRGSGQLVQYCITAIE